MWLHWWKFRNDTPEEYVRQTIEKDCKWHKYLPGQIKIEFTLQVGSNKPRADIVIWDKDAAEGHSTIISSSSVRKKL